MFALTRFSLFLGAALLSTSAVFASEWTVVKTSSAVKFTTDKTNWQVLSAGMTLPNKSWINTGSRGRVTLQRDTNVININPGTLAGVFNLGGSLDKTVVAQQTGVVAMDLERKSAPWMTVQTPFLAAVVKGTKFDVTIAKNEATVAVERGRVQVTDPNRGEQVNINGGQQASIDITSKSSMDVSGRGAIEPVQSVNKSQAVVPPTTQQKTEIEKSIKSSTTEDTSSKASKTTSKDTTEDSDSGKNQSGNGKSDSSSSSSSSSGKSSGSSSSSSQGNSSSSSSSSNSNSSSNGNGNGNGKGNGNGNGKGNGKGNGNSDGDDGDDD